MLACRTLIFFPLVSLILTTGCATGRHYQSGALRFEEFNAGIAVLHRDEQSTHYSLLHRAVLDAGARWHGTQYSNTLSGLVLWVNVPGSSWLLYPLQYHDLSDRKSMFGIGSGESDFRLSLLWGFISVGRNWNVLWLRGFWIGGKDPHYRKPAPAEVHEYYEQLSQRSSL